MKDRPAVETAGKTASKDGNASKMKKKKTVDAISDMDGVVDLNMVYHYVEQAKATERDEGSAKSLATSEIEESGCEESGLTLVDRAPDSDVEEDSDDDVEGGSGEEGEEGQMLMFVDEEDDSSCGDHGLEEVEEDEDAVGADGVEETDMASDGETKGAAPPDIGLVEVRDNIPEDEFLEALKERGMQAGSRGIDEDPFTNLEGATGEGSGPERGPVAIILAPTRELAMQIHAHITAVAKRTAIKVRGGASL